MSDKLVRLERVSRDFGPVKALQDVSLEIRRGEFMAIVGPSGCGKTTLLNILSGYDHPSSGTVDRGGRVRMVYQQDGLFPWKTAAENIAMGLRHLHDPKERAQQLKDLLELIGLQGFDKHYPHQLSGGMRQRVELARALAGDSDILLLDEPFSALDYITRLRMRRELALMLRERPRTVILVTHDIEEAAQLADRVVVLSGRPGRVECELSLEIARPRDVTHPEVVRAMHQILAELGLEKNGSAVDKELRERFETATGVAGKE